MASLFNFLFVPMILFIVIVLPLWLIFHYKTRWKVLNAQREQQAGTVSVDKKELKELHNIATRLGKRIDALEHVLDAEAPSWRER